MYYLKIIFTFFLQVINLLRNLFPPLLPSIPMSQEDYADLYDNLLVECHNLRAEIILLENKIREQQKSEQHEWSNDENK